MLIESWKRLPQGLRRIVGFVLKAVLTFGAFYLLLNHSIEDESGQPIVIWDAIVEHLATIEMDTFYPGFFCWRQVSKSSALSPACCVGIFSSVDKEFDSILVILWVRF